MKTIAEREMKLWRRNHPPTAGGCRALDVWFSRLPSGGSLGPWFTRELRGRSITLGEVDLPQPDVWAQHFGDDSSIIVISSSLIDFFEAISKVLTGNSVMASAHAPDVAATLTGSQASERLLELFGEWDKMWRGEKLRDNVVALSERASVGAALLSREILFFILMHEVGHVALHPDVRRPEDRLPKQEYQADRWALSPAVIGLQGMESHPSYGAVGATLAIRIIWALEQMGYHFTGSHPPARYRLAQLRCEWRRFLNSDARYFEFTGAAIQFEEQLAGAVEIMRGSRPVLTARRLVARLLLCLDMLGRGEISFEQTRDALANDLDRSTDAVLARATAIILKVMAEYASWAREDGPNAHDYRELVRTYTDFICSPKLPARLAVLRSNA